MQQLRQRAHGLVDVGELAAELFGETAAAEAVRGPVPQDRLRGLPEIELRVELAAEALDLQHGLLQQQQLRLHAHVEATCDLEQPHQHRRERDLLERLVEDRFADRAHGRFQFVDARVYGHPARVDVQPRDPVVVALEEREEVLGEVVLVARVERAHDAEVDRRVDRAFGILRLHEDVPGVHVGVEEVVAEHLGEEDLHAVFREYPDVDVAPAQLVHVVDEHAVDAFHDHHVGTAVVPVHLRHVEQLRPREIALELRRVRRLAHEVELVDDRALVLAHDLDRTQAMAFARIIASEVREDVHDLEVALDPLAHAGTHDLDDDFLARAQPRRVHLSDRGGGERLVVEAVEHLLGGPAIGALDDEFRVLYRERRHAVLQLGELVRDVGRQQVAPRGQGLAELDEDRAELLEREPDPFTARAALAPLEPRGGRQVERESQRAKQVGRENELVEVVPDEHALDVQETGGDAEAHGRK